CANGRVGIDYW
nr:immunoglobulin heavy chain junction region [Macaca mulatta]MOX37750.1 immunoglobulin heavy chain junction region [Macaca mulatta]MOX38000.1 immunoglobulin heavy chain junction region [Macaca mulatta]MOX38261.1 immunoglobulin heavy chain junction region [Macaca mulatta]MOX38377.1 immunoglobulin heavy chain junction region [Macaca mulatta]